MSQDAIELMPAIRFHLNQRRLTSQWPEVWALLDEIKDPEIPAISLWELGVLQDLQVTERNGHRIVTVFITPTYSGCPAITRMEEDIHKKLTEAGFAQISVERQLTPAWTTDYLCHEARSKLKAYGIAPPGDLGCPQCGEHQSELISEFGSTACKSLRSCNSCGEIYDYFKPL